MDAERLTPAEREQWAVTWRRRAEQLEAQAVGYRAAGDHDYAADLEAAAADNRQAAAAIELGVPA